MYDTYKPKQFSTALKDNKPTPNYDIQNYSFCRKFVQTNQAFRKYPELWSQRKYGYPYNLQPNVPSLPGYVKFLQETTFIQLVLSYTGSSIISS